VTAIDSRRARGLFFWLAAATAFTSAPAAANTQFAVEGRVSAGVADLSDSSAEDEGRFANLDAFTMLMPRGLMLRSSARAHHLGSYTLSTRLNLARAGGNTLSNRVDWRSRILTSPDGDLSFGAGVHQGHTSAYDLAFPQIVEPFPSGGIHYMAGDAHQRYAHRLGRVWYLGQSAEAGLYYPFRGDFEVDHSYQAGGGLELQRRFRYESITGGIRGRYVSIARPEVEGGALPTSDRHVVGNVDLSGSRALSPVLTADLGVGLVAASNVEGLGDPLILPTARALLRYMVGAGSAGLSYRYDIDTRLVVGETSAMHLVQLSGVVPVRSLDGVWLAGAVGYRTGQILDTTSRAFLGRSNVFLLDGQVAWEFRRGFTASARVQSHQHRRSDLEGAFGGQQSRSQVMLSLSARYPSELSTPIPPGAGARWAADPAGVAGPEPEGEAASP
jgi:hypothetical protein